MGFKRRVALHFVAREYSAKGIVAILRSGKFDVIADEIQGFARAVVLRRADFDFLADKRLGHRIRLVVCRSPGPRRVAEWIELL